jgi:hypothetical protein
MKTKAILAIALMFAMALVAFVPMESDDATVSSIIIQNGSEITVDKGKTINLVLEYTADRNDSCTIKVIETYNKSTVWTDNYTFLVGDHSLEIPLDTSKLSGSSPVQMKITFSDGVYKDLSFTIKYATSIWDNWTTYLAIAVVIILIVAFIVYKSRSAPKVKNQLTFEEIEAQKQAEKKTATKKSAPVKSERQRYLDSKKK